jgi:hypothetical protein
MRKLLILTVFAISFIEMHSQEVFFNTGTNFTQYNYTNSKGESNSNLKSGQGLFFELGYAIPFEDDRYKYSLALSLNGYNTFGGNSASNYSWDTNFLGIKNNLSFKMFDSDAFDFSVNGGLTFSYMIYGRQTINDTYYDLSGQKEFSGLWIAPSIGVQAKCIVTRDINLSFGYNIIKNFNTGNSSPEKLSFTTNQIQFGIHLELN